MCKSGEMTFFPSFPRMNFSTSFCRTFIAPYWEIQVLQKGGTIDEQAGNKKSVIEHCQLISGSNDFAGLWVKLIERWTSYLSRCDVSHGLSKRGKLWTIVKFEGMPSLNFFIGITMKTKQECFPWQKFVNSFLKTATKLEVLQVGNFLKT